jgi:hypothetical protein
VRLRRTLAALVLAIGFSVVSLQAPASASALTSCPAGTGCVWTDIFGYGQIAIFPFSLYGAGHCYGFSYKFNDQVKSAFSGYGPGHQLQVWSNNNCTGEHENVYKDFIETFIDSPGWSSFIIT